MAYRRLPKGYGWPFAGMVAGAVIAALTTGQNQFALIVACVVGLIAGMVVDSMLKRR